MVGTYPETRYEGHIREMMKPAFEDMKTNGLAYSMMSPFRDSFYARFGYVTTNTHMIVKVLLNGLRYALDVQIDDDWAVERCRAATVKKKFLDFVWEIAPSRFHGFVIYPSLSDEEWKRRNKDRLIVIIKKQGQIEAVARYRTKGFGHGAMGPVGEILVDEMYWRTLGARSILFNFFAKHIDQVKYITMNLPFGTNVQQWIIDQMEFVDIKLWFPWCSRIIDVEPALASLPAEGEAEFTFRLSDTHCDWNNGTYTLTAESGRLIINKNAANPDVKLTIEGLSALVYGTLSLNEIEFKGWVKISDLSAKKTLNQWFPPIPIYSAFGY